MDDRVHRMAALANVSAYNNAATKDYVDGAPHVKHASLRTLYGSLLVKVFDRAHTYIKVPKVLDLGAGEGSVTLPFLELGAKVVAVDISPSQLDALRSRCVKFGENLDTRCQDIYDALTDTSEIYDIIVVNSFLHHVPDYLALIGASAARLSDRGQFFSFQDPLRYDSVSKSTVRFSNLAYFSWRLFKGDIFGGISRRLRRSRGIYFEDSVHDNAEYHVVRNGVDQDAIRGHLESLGFRCEILYYFSTQSRFFQIVGAALGIKNTFAVVAQKHELDLRRRR